MVELVDALVPAVDTKQGIWGDVPLRMSSQCVTCDHWTSGLSCEAFPDGIPEQIWKAGRDHSRPFPGDGGLMYADIGQEEVIEGGWGSGNFDHLGGDGKGPGGSQARGGAGLSKEVRLSRHAFQRMGERKKYASVKAGLKSLKDKEVPDGDWHMGVKRGGKLDAVLIGTDGVVKTVLGPWAKNLKGDNLGED